MEPQPAEESVEAVLDKIVYANEENAWSVVRLRSPDGAELTATGNLLGVSPGETLRLTGRWEKDPKFGRQFRVVSYLTVTPSTLQGIERYLGSGLIPGIGPVMAERLVGKFGLETLDVIEHHPERLARVPGIGKKRRAEIRRAWVEQRRIRDLMVFLQGHGVSPTLAVKIYKAWGEEALGRVRSEPWSLAREVWGIGFATADSIASALGLPHDSPARARAAVVHLLDEASGRGHAFLPRAELVRLGAELLAAPPELVEAAVTDAAAAGEVVVEPREADPEAPGGAGDAVYPAPLHHAESNLARRLTELLGRRAGGPPIDTPAALAWFEGRHGIELAPEQREAVSRGLEEKVLVVTGGPGTGKTTLVRALVEILTVKGARVLLGAPTGRAAKRLGEATGHEAKTIHRLLEFNAHTRRFERDADEPLEADLVVVDEASMLDTYLARSLLEAVPDDARLVLVGDVDQLPSVGPGRVLADLIGSGALPVVRLSTIFRQAQESLIVANAHRVNQGLMPARPAPGSEADFFFIERTEPEEVLSTLLHLASERIPASFGLDPFTDLQVLSPMNRGPLGTINLNEELRKRLNPGSGGEDREIARGAKSFRVGDKVMQIRNNYDLAVFNGDLGRVVDLDAEERRVTVLFEDQRVRYEAADLDELVLAYACSIHKSQGSEYPAIVVPVHTQHWVMLQRNLLYTALTRARRLAVFVGQTRALAVAVRNQDTRHRWTMLAERLRRGG